MFYLAALLVIIFDQALKLLVTYKMQLGQSIPLIQNILNLTYVRNQGAAWGLFYGQSLLLFIVAIVVILFVLYYHYNLSRKDIIQLGLGLILGGSLGNTIDRVTRGYVVDYIDFIIFPVFNLADMMINLGVFVVFIRLFFSREDRDVTSPL
jgi:signal peptidase II